MAQLSISAVAKQAGLRASAIRYYERIGLLPAPRRVAGQRRYDAGAVYRLAVIRRAQDAGLSLEDARQLLSRDGSAATVSARWKEIADAKIGELESKIEEIQAIKSLLVRLQNGCKCETVEQCGEGILKDRTFLRRRASTTMLVD